MARLRRIGKTIYRIKVGKPPFVGFQCHDLFMLAF
jgi:hypothetical protein